jgi:hypothetical protein
MEFYLTVIGWLNVFASRKFIDTVMIHSREYSFAIFLTTNQLPEVGAYVEPFRLKRRRVLDKVIEKTVSTVLYLQSDWRESISQQPSFYLNSLIRIQHYL